MLQGGCISEVYTKKDGTYVWYNEVIIKIIVGEDRFSVGRGTGIITVTKILMCSLYMLSCRLWTQILGTF